MDIFNHFSKKVALTFLLSIGTFFSYGQENWSMDKFLLHSFQSPAQQFEDQKVELLEDGNYRLPLIENLQFRTETRDFDLDLQQYDLRLNTNSFRSINAQEDLNKTELEITKLHHSIVLKNELANRYNVLLSLVFQRDLLALINQRLAIQNDKLSVLKSLSSWDLPKIKEVIKVESSILETELKKIKTENRLRILQDRITDMCGQEISIVTDDFIAARFIKKHFNKIILSDSIASKQMEMAKLEIEKNQQEQILQF